MTIISIILQVVALIAFFMVTYQDYITIGDLKECNAMLREQLSIERDVNELNRLHEEDVKEYRTEYKTVFLGYSPFCVNATGAREEMKRNDELATQLANDGWKIYEKEFINNGQAMFWAIVFGKDVEINPQNN